MNKSIKIGSILNVGVTKQSLQIKKQSIFVTNPLDGNDTITMNGGQICSILILQKIIVSQGSKVTEID